jgi:hypothetical protein
MKKLITLFSISLFVLMFISCNHKQEKEQHKKKKEQVVTGGSRYIDLVNNEKERTRLWKAAIDSGDCFAYNKIALAYLMTYREVDLYYYSLIMANKYHCPEAYRTLNSILTHEAYASGDRVMLFSNDRNTKNLAFYYLFKAKELGSSQAKNDIELEFGKGKSVPNSSFFLKKLMNP